jgi:hypothetical protein
MSTTSTRDSNSWMKDWGMAIRGLFSPIRTVHSVRVLGQTSMDFSAGSGKLVNI